MGFTLESAAVLAILEGVWRSTKKSYYRISPDTGRHVSCKIKRELMNLGMCGSIASRLLQSANFPSAPFKHNRPRKLQKPLPTHSEQEIKVKTYEPNPATHPQASPPAAPEPPPPSPSKKKTGLALLSEDQRQKRAQAAELQNAKRYQLIETSTHKHGVWDEVAGSVIALFYRRDDAIEELNRLKTNPYLRNHNL